MKMHDTCQQRALVVLKIGGSILTKSDEESQVDKGNVSQIVKEISQWWKSCSGCQSLILVLGAGLVGHPLAHKYGLNNPNSVQKSEFGFSLTVSKMIELAKKVVDEFLRNGVSCMPMQSSCFFASNKGRIVQAGLERVQLALSRGLIPVFWGDAILDISEKFRILSGDQIACYFYEKLPVERLLFGTDVDGVCTYDPKKDVKAKRIDLLTDREFENMLSITGSSRSCDVTGGLKGKLLEIHNTSKRPVLCQIYNAAILGNTLAALRGENVGTTIRLSKDRKEVTSDH